ncbi:MAG: Bacterial ribosome SSU maturation protein RimP, partial [uncultured Rubrobacteraceae bacterium]
GRGCGGRASPGERARRRPIFGRTAADAARGPGGRPGGPRVLLKGRVGRWARGRGRGIRRTCGDLLPRHREAAHEARALQAIRGARGQGTRRRADRRPAQLRRHHREGRRGHFHTKTLGGGGEGGVAVRLRCPRQPQGGHI